MLKTEDCRKWLASDTDIQQLVKDRYGWDPDFNIMLEMCDDDPEEVAYVNKIVKKAAMPKSWKRTHKYKLGSKTDKDWFDYDSNFPPGTEGVIRHFQLLDHEVVVVILERDGQLTFLDEHCD